MVFLSFEEAILITLEEVARAIENEEVTPIFLQEEEVSNTFLGSGSGKGSEGEGNEGCRHRDEITDS